MLTKLWHKVIGTEKRVARKALQYLLEGKIESGAFSAYGRVFPLREGEGFHVCALGALYVGWKGMPSSGYIDSDDVKKMIKSGIVSAQEASNIETFYEGAQGPFHRSMYTPPYMSMIAGRYKKEERTQMVLERIVKKGKFDYSDLTLN